MSEESVDSQVEVEAVAVDPIFNTAVEAIIETFKKIPSFGTVLAPSQQLLLGEFLQGITNRNPTPTNGLDVLFKKLITHLRVVEDGAVSGLFTYFEKAKKTCYLCETKSKYANLCCGHTLVASKLRELKALFKTKLSFEDVIKLSMFEQTENCFNPLCRKHNRVERELNKLPSVFVLALNWEINETHVKTIEKTMRLLETSIDLTNVYKYDGEPPLVAHDLIAMVCRGAEGYFCVSYNNDTWYKHSVIESKTLKLPFGPWSDVIKDFSHLKFRPDLLFYHEVQACSSSQCVASDTEDDEGDDVCDNRMRKKSKKHH